jgi:hypothetical protein
VVIRLGGSGSFPGYRVGYETDPIPLDPSDQKVYLRGKATLAVHVAAWMPDTDGHGYAGPTRIFPTNVTAIKELRQTRNFEGYNTWAIGIDVKRSFRVFRLSNPPRLVIDIRR